MVDRLGRVPAWAWLAVIVAGSVALRAWLGSRMPAPFIFTDELTYQENARSLAAGEGIRVRDEPYGIVSVLYPLVLAPAYLLFDSLPDAYAAARTINAVVMSLAAIPAYLIARRVLPTRSSLLAALLAVALPVARLHGHADVRERVLSGVPARGVGAAPCAGGADAGAAGGAARDLRRRHARPGAGPGRAARSPLGAGSAPARRPPAAPAVVAAVRRRRRRRLPRPPRPARARRVDLEPLRRLRGRRRGELRRGRGAEVSLLAPGRARSLRRRHSPCRLPPARRADPLARAAGAGVRGRDGDADGVDDSWSWPRSPRGSRGRSWSATCSSSPRSC